ncbi:MAG: alpha/beta fold hydrolase [Desulfatibacillaceae bacterium]
MKENRTSVSNTRRERGTNTLRTGDGRRLAWIELGPPDGAPLFYFHGFPASRLEGIFTEPYAWELGLRVIAMDRPGMGLADPLPGRRIGDWPGDVERVADELGLGTFAALGVSGGGPYLLACAAKIPHRLLSATTACGLGPPESFSAEGRLAVLRDMLFGLVHRHPEAAGPIASISRPLAVRLAPLVHRVTTAVAPAADRRAMRDPRVGLIVTESLAEAFRQGTDGPSRELRLYSNPWDFDLSDIRVPVRLWHGTSDNVVPVSDCRYLEQHLPYCRATYVPGEAHFSLVMNHAREILGEIAA